MLTRELAEGYAALALDNVRREFPNAPQHVLDAATTVRPRDLHPAFYGSFDWHSCVHMHWLLARLLGRFPDLAGASDVAATLDAHLTPTALATEAAYLAAHPTFERPYGWGWSLRLVAELAGTPWAEAAGVLADAVMTRFADWLPRATYPVRHGVHSNSALGLLLALPYEPARPLVSEAALRWFGDDRDYPARWEPSGEDFVSPALVEAALMAAVLGPDFPAWLDGFLPRLDPLLQPAVVSDRSDYRIVHLDGLNLSRAWCFEHVRRALDAADERVAALAGARERHLAAALPHVASGGYGGDHWLASFAVLALDD